MSAENNISIFEEKYNRLNPEQKLAVDTYEGTVMVKAGPGTGKTDILSIRIGNILLKTQVSPYNILCLTYTDAGVKAMRQRLEKYLGAEAYKVNIHTFHSLCNEIIHSFSFYFGYTDLKPISAIDQIELLQKMIDEIPANSKLKRFKGDVYYDNTAFKNLFQSIKKEALNIDETINVVNHYCENNRTQFEYTKKYKEFKAGDLKIAKWQECLDDNQKLIDAINYYNVFQNMMLENKFYDFDDMILWVINAFENDKNFLLNFQEKYQYILVDEFQDTNGSQLKLVNYLAEYYENPNLFIVGDIDQSIYRFQGAETDNFVNFKKKYTKNLIEIELKENYRSSQSILNASRSLININGEVRSPLKAGNKEFANHQINPQIFEYENPIAETVSLGLKIKNLIEIEKVNPNEIAVIYNKHKLSEDLIKHLNILKIPYNVQKDVNVLEENLIKKMLRIIEYVALESNKPSSGEHLIFEIFNLDFYQTSAYEIAKLTFEKKYQKWRDFLNEKFSEKQNDLFGNLPSENPLKEIIRLNLDLEYWIKESFNSNVPQLIEKIIAKSGILSYVMNQEGEKDWNLQILSTFFNFIKEESIRKPTMNLIDFIEVIKKHRKEYISINTVKVYKSDNSINLMSFHSCKGLEFEHVFLIGLNQNLWEKVKNNSDFEFKKRFYNSSDDKLEDTLEKRRLFYVGMTRAKKELEMSYCKEDIKGKGLVKLEFLSELLDVAKLDVKSILTSENNDLKSEINNFLILNYDVDDIAKHINKNDFLDNELMNNWFRSYKISPTNLNDYVNCPLSFYYKHVLKVPSAKNTSTSFGNAVHGALEMYFEEQRKYAKGHVPPLEFLIESFISKMNQHRDGFSEIEYKNHIELGNKILPDYYKSRVDLWKTETFYRCEENVYGMFEDIPIKGKIDKVVQTETKGKIHLVDFKTGKYDKARKKLNAPNPDSVKEEEKQGGDYWRQMAFYGLLINHSSNKEYYFSSGCFDFIEPDEKGHFNIITMNIGQDDLLKLSNQLRESWEGIKNFQFEKGCNEEHCYWCNFQKYYLKKQVFTHNKNKEKEEHEE